MRLLRSDGSCEDMPLVTTLDALQLLVGGYIEMVNFTDGSALIVNEEGLLLDLPDNPAAIDLVAAKHRGGRIVGDVLYLTPAENKKMSKS